jgi:hypothetical protein
MECTKKYIDKIFVIVILFFICSGYTKNIDRSFAIVIPDASGRFYAKSEPRVGSPYTTVGYTTVFQVREHNDKELGRFDWFCSDLYVHLEGDSIHLLCHDQNLGSMRIDNPGYQERYPYPTITPYVSGRYYIKSVPKSNKQYSTIGYTIAYKVKKYTDREIVRYNWYCQDLYLFSINDSLYAVRLNGRLQGTAANYSDIAVGFYHNERKIKEYSTLTIARNPFNILKGEFSYSVISAAPELMFYDMPDPDECVFTIMTVDHRYLHFDVRTGDLLDDRRH